MQCRTWAPCPLTPQEVCGTDGKTYTNDCFLRKQTCLSGGLTKLKYRGPCGKLTWGEGASLALVGHPSSDGVTIKMPYGVDVLHRPASHPIFSYWVG